jgi:hypothetical protein
MTVLLVRPVVNFKDLYERFDTIPITEGNTYKAQLTPTIYDPHTFQPVEKHVIVQCDDGHYRKFPLRLFIEVSEWRQQQLNKLL